MKPPESARPHESVVQIVAPDDGWVLERLARILVAKLPYAIFVPWRPQAFPATRLVYYVNYALLEERSGLVDVVFFTHPDETHQSVERARLANACVCMARQYADLLTSQGVQSVIHIPMGFDSYRYRPRLVLGVIGRLEHPRKGRALVDLVRTLPFVEVVTTEGKTAPEDLLGVYERLDYVLVPATLEGGPLCLLEGLALGKPVIAPQRVGLVSELGQSGQIRLYPAGDGEALVQLVTRCFQEKEARTRLVRGRSWDHWAEHHHHFFMSLLRSRGIPTPVPALGFRFGMLSELDIPPARMDLTPLENAVDEAARHLFHGATLSARIVLEQTLRQYPFAEKLLRGMP